MTDRIEVTGLRVLGRHGVLPEERERSQPFEIDLEIEADLAMAASSDDLAVTVDYGAVVGQVTELVATRRFQLLEALAEAVAACVLAAPRALAVTVTVRKLRPPVAADLGSVAVTLRRQAR
ncbi:MAG: dihydroneopterin aldolase [Acidimicrobiales bacterium]